MVRQNRRSSNLISAGSLPVDDEDDDGNENPLFGEDSVGELDFRAGGSGNGNPSAASGGGGGGVRSRYTSGFTSSAMRGKKSGEMTVHDYIPKSYQYNPAAAEPILYYMPKTMASLQHQAKQVAAAAIAAQEKMIAAGHAVPNTTPPVSAATAPTGATLRTLLIAAEEDVRLHRARAKAALEQDLRRLRTYRLENDPVWMKRKEILEERNTIIDQLQTDSQQIWNDLLQAQDDNKKKKEMDTLSPAERQQLQLARWQKALELFVYCPLPTTYTEKAEEGAKARAKALKESKDGKKKKKDKKKDNEPPPVVHPLPDVMDPAIILDSLLEQGAAGANTTTTAAGGEEDDMSAMLQEASNMCQSLVEITHKQCASAAQQVLSQEESYSIRLEAHELFLRTALTKCEEIQDQFQVNGRAALQIGHQLEFAETKRRQCEATSKLIRLWWMLEALAEEEARTNNTIKVEEEVRGVIPPTSCRMNPLFVRPEQSLEAARALKQLRAVVRSRGNATSTSASTAAAAAATAAPAVGGAGGGGTDQSPSQRFDWTANLITRTSDALEQRLLHSFSEIYAQGGSYDFSLKPRPGSIDWRELQALAEALLMFDSGRNLHKRYVDMVITSRFPELFEKKANEKRSPRHRKEEEGFDMDATRSNLSTLFHRVSDVCSAEFELIAHVFGSDQTRADPLEGNEPMPLVVARALLQRVISDPINGLQARINDILASIDQRGDFDAGSKKLDTFVVIHEKASGLFSLLKDSAQKMILKETAKKSVDSDLKNKGLDSTSRQSQAIARNAVESLKGFLTSQELSLSNTHRQGYINLELRLLHHQCCSSLDKSGCTLLIPPAPRRRDSTLAEKGILEEYRAPVVPLDKQQLLKSGLNALLSGPLKQSVLLQPLVHATESLARARLMFSSGKKKGGETTARVVCSIYSQMCSFYGEGFLYPIMEVLRDTRKTNPPAQPPQLPFNQDMPAHDLGVEQHFWVCLERLHSAAKAFDREMWAEGRADTGRVWEILERCDDQDSMSKARACRFEFYSELERRGEAAIMKALDSISAHIHWILVSGGEGMLATGANRLMANITGSSAGPYAVPQGANMDSSLSPAVESLVYCLRVQFVHVQSAMTSHSVAGFWTALSMRLYDILVARLLKHYQVSQQGAAILRGDVDALRGASMLSSGSPHDHWDMLQELITLYMIPPDSVKGMLVGPEGDMSLGKGLFGRAGRDQCLVFLSRRVDYKFKQGASLKRSGWAEGLLNDLGLSDPTDHGINIGLFAAERKP
ncbi:expressed unknown protein [Seminavis robusta]|uniref:Exocyst complex component Sec10-like alpha-helical bundle domain-containing protein n=1 Tax=Seminavis robusta TaxID=568900 RepID=A0A9N8EYH3_9STRA|nr:expressed unknown protein [Seminavis robusta]|eukprot:Sro2123_g315570.1 n/a (1271) ;mRNA; f:13846-17749